MNSLLRCFVLLGVLFVGVLSVVPIAAAQTEIAAETDAADTEDRATQFRTTAGPQTDQVPGGKLLIGAYGLAWMAILAFMWLRIDRQQKRATSELERLASVVDRHLNEEGKS